MKGCGRAYGSECGVIRNGSCATALFPIIWMILTCAGRGWYSTRLFARRSSIGEIFSSGVLRQEALGFDHSKNLHSD